MTDELTDQPIEQLVDRLKHKGISRSRFVAALAGLGVSATGIATLVSAAEADATTLPPRGTPAHHATEQHHQRLHHEHIRRQGAATHGEPVAAATTDAMNPALAQKLDEILADYADDAVVRDPLFDRPIVGKDAIARRKMAELVSMRGVTIEVGNRVAHRDQVVAEWTVRGTHAGPFMGYTATGRQIQVRGMTVVTRKGGKITEESLYYDAADVHRQLS